MRSHLSKCLAITLLLILSGCYLHEDSISGILIDDETGAPITDAYITVQWSGNIASLVDSSPNCLHVAVSKTREDGSFYIPSWTGFFLSLNGSSAKREWQAYKPGYDLAFAAPIGEQFRVRKFSGTPQDRLSELYSRSGFMCLEGGSSSKSELPVLDEILKEVYALPGGAKPITFNNQAANVPEKIQYEICTLRSITFMSNIDKKSYEQCRASYRK